MSIIRSGSLLLAFIVFSFLVLPLSGGKAVTEAKAKSPLKSHLSFVVVDLDGDGIELIPLEESNVYFDIDGDGLATLPRILVIVKTVVMRHVLCCHFRKRSIMALLIV
jgi:hypothetical protein